MKKCLVIEKRRQGEPASGGPTLEDLSEEVMFE